MRERRFFTLLEGMRGVAAIFVVLRHIRGIAYPIDFRLSGISVDLFFVLSGLVIAHSYEHRLLLSEISFRKFAAKRIIRIFPLYLIGSCIGLICVALTGSTSIQKTGLNIVFGLVMLPQPLSSQAMYPLDHPAWSLFFEFVASFVYAFFIRRLSNRVILGSIVVCWGMLILCGIMTGGRIDQIGWELPTLPLGLCRVFAGFFIGVLLHRLVGSEAKTIDWGIGNLGSIGILVMMVILLTIPVGEAWAWIYCLLVAGFAFPALVYAAIAARPSGTLKKTLSLLGEMSFPLYVLHVPLADLLNLLARKTVRQHAPYSGLAFIIGIAIFAIFVNRHVDVPLRKWITPKLFARPSKYAPERSGPPAQGRGDGANAAYPSALR